jgi:hypothetical protein
MFALISPWRPVGIGQLWLAPDVRLGREIHLNSTPEMSLFLADPHPTDYCHLQ